VMGRGKADQSRLASEDLLISQESGRLAKIDGRAREKQMHG
jgi:hypothetical protein